VLTRSERRFCARAFRSVVAVLIVAGYCSGRSAGSNLFADDSNTKDHSQQGDWSTKPGFRQCNVLLVDGAVQNQKTRLLLDTGAATTVLNSAIMTDSPITNLEMQRVFVGSRTSMARRRDSVTVECLGFATRELNVLEMDLRSLSQFAGQEIGAVVGMDVLGTRVLSIGEDGPEFTSTLPHTFRDEVGKQLHFSGAIPMLPLELPVLGVREFKVDTGLNGYLLVTTQFAKFMMKSGTAVPLGTTDVADASDIRLSRRILIQKITFLGKALENVPAVVSEINCIGMLLLDRFPIALDFPNKRYYVKPISPTHIEEFPVSASGVGYVFRTSKSLFVETVEGNSPGAEAGIRVGDEILSLEGKSPLEFSRKDIQMLFAQAGETVHLGMKRDGEPFDVELILRHDFEYPPKWSTAPSNTNDFQDWLEHQGKE